VAKVTIRAMEECHCKVRLRDPDPGYEILPLGQNQWRAILPAAEATTLQTSNQAPQG
jgi:hypothetical protein